MSTCLLGEHISIDNTRHVLAANTYDSIVAALDKTLEDTPNNNNKNAQWIPVDNEAQRAVLLELLAHVIRVSREFGLSAETTSTFFGVVVQTHIDSMQQHASMKEAHDIFQSYMVAHSVHRPPYSAAIFTIDEVRNLSDFMLQAYFRHYRMYLHVFTPRRECTLRCAVAQRLNEIPKLPPALTSGVPLKDWEAKQAELRRVQEAEEARRKEEEEAVAAAAEAERRKAAADEVPNTLSAQLSLIRETVGKISGDKFDELDQRLQQMETKMLEVQKNATQTKGKKK